MRGAPFSAVLRHLRHMAAAPLHTDLSDKELLQRFVTFQDEIAPQKVCSGCVGGLPEYPPPPPGR
jgi:hypothetical protein